MIASDEKLICACRRGDSDAWEALVMRYQRLIFSIARRGGLDGDQASEVLQHVFMLLYQNIDRIDQPDRIRSWLTTVARRETITVRQKMRSAVLQPSMDEDEHILSLPDEGSLPIEIMIQLERQQIVRTALAMLDERCRNLLEYLFMNEDSPSYTKIAETLGMPPGSIGPTRARCLQKLRTLLEDSGL